jgi:hypothetical protein
MTKTTTIFFGVITVMLMVLSFFVGSIIEQNSHVERELDSWNTIETQQAQLDEFNYNADYNAMFNFKAKEVTENCGPCSIKLSAVQLRLDSIEKYRGILVIPKSGYRSDRKVSSQ